MEYNNAIANAYADAQRRVYDIQNQLSDFEYQVEAAKYEMSQPSGMGMEQLPASQVQTIGDIDASINALYGVDDLINQYEDLMGPVKGRIGAKNPYDTRAQVFNSQMTAVAQDVGRSLEGGVLRQEDVPKYRAMFPQISDTPDVARGKMQNVLGLLNNKKTSYQQAFSGSGYDPGNLGLSQLYDQYGG